MTPTQKPPTPEEMQAAREAMRESVREMKETARPHITIWRKIKRVARMARAVAQDRRVPRWLRWGLVASIGLPVPGPFDEILAALLLAVVVWRFPDVWRDAKEGSA